MGSGCSSEKSQTDGNGGTKTLPSLKIAVIGETESGKTSIIQRYVHNQFSYVYIPTKRAVIENSVRTLNIPGHAVVSVTFWDIPGEEDIVLYSSYFRDLDAAIVVVDLTRPESVELAGHWREVVLTNATRTKPGTQTDGDTLIDPDSPPETIPVDPDTFPILLLGSKMDLVVQNGVIPHTEEESGQGETGGREKPEEAKSVPPCVKELTAEAEKHHYVGSVAVSAKLGDSSVHAAVQNFVRHILESRYLPRLRKTPASSSRRVRKTPQHLQLSGLSKFDAEFESANVLVDRVETLLGFSQKSLEKFFTLCLRAGVLTTLIGASLEDTIISLRQHAKEHNRKLQMIQEEGFCVLTLKASDEPETKDSRALHKIIKCFNKEYSAVCKAMLHEFPKIENLLQQLEQKVEALCDNFQPPPAEEQNKQEKTTVISAKDLAHLLENNRARMRQSRQEARDACKSVENAHKKAMAAFYW